MIRGLRASDAPTLQRLCGADMKLFLRLGALLQARLAITEVALEAAVALPAGHALLMDRRLKDTAPADFAALVAALAGGELDLTMLGEEDGIEAGWRVVALADELGNPLVAEPPAAAAEPALELNQLSVLMPTLSPAIRAPLEGLLQARADDQRAAALEQLRYAMPPLPVVSELMPMILSDAAELVRERAIGLLAASGAHGLVVDIIRALIRRDDQALARMQEPVGLLPGIQQDLVVSALIAALSRGNVSQALVDTCRAMSTHLASHRSLPRLIELLLPSRLSLLDLVRELQSVDAPRIDSILLSHLGMGSERDAQLVVLLAYARRALEPADQQRLLDIGVDLLLSPRDVPPERMALASALHRLDSGSALASRLAARGTSLAQAYDTSVYWLLAELCRDGAIPPAEGEQLAVSIRRLLREASGPHVIAILEQQLPSLLPAGEDVRATLVEPMVETIARFIDDRSRDLVVFCLIGIGAPAIDPLWRLLEEHPHIEVRLVSAELLQQLLWESPAPTVAAAVARLLRDSGRAEQGRERAAQVTAAARLSGAPALAQDSAPALSVDASAEGLGRWRTEALGLLAASGHLGEERRARIIRDLLDEVTVEIPSGADQTIADAATDSVTFVLDERLGHHTETMPEVLTALLRISGSPGLPREQLRSMVARMCLQWQRVSTWKVVWGPGNVQELARTLAMMAERQDFPGPLRLQICEALLPGITQLAIARSLARVFTASDGSYLSRLAGRAAEKLIALASEGYFAEDELEGLVEVLVDYLAIPHLGTEAAAVRRKLVILISVQRANLSSRARAKLRYLMADLEQELTLKLDWAR
jgi:hypothetical protein